jgi:hypothetical protein
MPPYLLVETFWEAEGNKIEEKSRTNSRKREANAKRRNARTRPSVSPSLKYFLP